MKLPSWCYQFLFFISACHWPYCPSTKLSSIVLVRWSRAGSPPAWLVVRCWDACLPLGPVINLVVVIQWLLPAWFGLLDQLLCPLFKHRHADSLSNNQWFCCWYPYKPRVSSLIIIFDIQKVYPADIVFRPVLIAELSLPRLRGRLISIQQWMITWGVC